MSSGRITELPLDEREALVEIALERGLLSGRELAILQWWSKGYGVGKTARLLGLHESTVRTFRDRALRKLSAYVRRAS